MSSNEPATTAARQLPVSAADVTVRPPRPEELSRLLAIWRAAVEGSHLFLTPADVDWYQELVAGYLPQMVDLRVADDKGQLVGFIAQEEGEIYMLFVDPSAQGRGVGTTLIDDVGRQHTVLRLDVNEQNPTAVAFYFSRGFGQVGRSDFDGQGRPFPLLHLERTVN